VGVGRATLVKLKEGRRNIILPIKRYKEKEV
jgi:hypothetical protein